MTLHQASLLTAHRERISRLGGTGYILPPLPPVEVSPPQPARWGSIVLTLLTTLPVLRAVALYITKEN